jgi:uncharacterized membrane protein YqjE
MGDDAGKAPDQRGLFASTRGLLRTGVTLLHNRLELFGVELAEERTRLVSVLVYGAAAFVCIAAGVIFLAVFVTVLLWDSNRLLALGVFTALFLGAGIASLTLAIGLARSGSKLFAASLAELRKDADVLAADEVTGAR